METTYTRTIPDNMRPWRCEVNGKRYVYEPGTEQNVPYEVAALIDAYWAKQESKFPDMRMSYNELKDRPCYEETVTLFDKTVEFAEIEGMLGGQATNYNGLEIGETYTVTYNGAEYECTANNPYEGETENVFIGNNSVFGMEDTGEPFFMVCIYDAADNIQAYVFEIISLDGSTSASIKIEKTVVHTIDPKFLPSSGGSTMTVEVWYDSAQETYTYSPKAAFNDVVLALASGTIVQFILRDLNNETFFNFLRPAEGKIVLDTGYLRFYDRINTYFEWSAENGFYLAK